MKVPLSPPLLGLLALASPVGACAGAPQASAPQGLAAAPEPPRLVLAITVDQLRADVPGAWRERFGEGGFRRLLDEGVVYTEAGYRHTSTFTAVGHATLFTGAHPIHHGVISNEWMDPVTGEHVYCVQDPTHGLVGGVPGGPHAGTSPANLMLPTVGDALLAASEGSRVFSVSVKDRGAILPAGRDGRAYWYSSKTGGFQTSTYYTDALPPWVSDWNERGLADLHAGGHWELGFPPEAYTLLDQDDRAAERPPQGLRRTFPHPLPEGPKLYSMLRFTSLGDELTLSFVEALFAAEEPGQRGATDFLAVSFSCTDYIGHAFGPNSLEAEDNLLRLDRTLARLLDLVDATVGLDRTVITLSSDHGIGAAPEHIHAGACAEREAGGDWIPRHPGEPLLVNAVTGELCCPAGRLDPGVLMDRANGYLRERHGLGREARPVRAFRNPTLYLDEDLLAAHDLDPARVEQEVARLLEDVPGVTAAFSHRALRAGSAPEGPFRDPVARSLHPARSGGVVILQDPGWNLYSDPYRDACMHGSPHPYDTRVPVILRVPGVPAATVDRPVGPHDMAPTLAALLGIRLEGADGTPLAEVIAGGEVGLIEAGSDR